MKIQEVIQLVVDNHYKDWMGSPILPETSRDQILYGNANTECTGVVTAIYASPEVIRQAAKLGANLIVVHESLFWNHGDHTDWLVDNTTFQQKKQLLDDYQIVVWRDHDYIHAGVKWQGQRVDGIFYGLVEALQWQEYVIGDLTIPVRLDLPATSVRDVGKWILEKLNLKGIKCIGDLEGIVSKVVIPFHMTGRDREIIGRIDKENLDTILAMELIDYTAAIHVRDSAELGQNRRILAIGHFNLEEAGMKWFGETYLPTILPAGLSVNFIPLGDLYGFL